ncbi:phytanoyl-CoA dioxygenase family protein [Mycobacteroides salmoniphilum]|uniref:phytanoyl-CoA dioxygenase family protein n=1 Tax=Mycobacteroides salmoniphilum TaxID=404941 RepID=UPI0009943FB9|nr:phytanoyl-CoA dioxygenase family protein [Mycobacteroides salmoniphilum]
MSIATSSHPARRLAATYREAGYAHIDFDDFHQHKLPQDMGDALWRDAARDVIGRPPLAVRLDDGRAYSYVANRGVIEIHRGVVEDAETVLGIDEHAWIDYVYGFRSRFGLIYSRAVEFVRGDFAGWDAWDPAMLCMYSGQEVYDPLRVDLRDLDGSPLDLQRTFDIDDSQVQMSHFLRTTGYLVVRNAFPAAQIQMISDEVDRLRDMAKEGDFGTYFTTLADGRKMCNYLNYCGERSAPIAALDDDPTVRKLMALSGFDLVPVPDRVEGHKVILKEFGPDSTATGLGNTPWHTDCGMGGCTIVCPSVSVGMPLDVMDEDSSQLFQMPGSWGKAAHQIWDEEREAKRVPLKAQPGDATVHFGCNLHAGLPPTGHGRRRTLYTAFYSPQVHEIIGHHQSYQDQIPGFNEGQMQSIKDRLAEEATPTN